MKQDNSNYKVISYEEGKNEQMYKVLDKDELRFLNKKFVYIIEVPNGENGETYKLYINMLDPFVNKIYFNLADTYGKNNEHNTETLLKSLNIINNDKNFCIISGTNNNINEQQFKDNKLNIKNIPIPIDKEKFHKAIKEILKLNEKKIKETNNIRKFSHYNYSYGPFSCGCTCSSVNLDNENEIINIIN